MTASEPKYITRSIEPVVRKAAEEFAAVVLTGPRQSGKTTLLRHLFGDKYRYVSLEPPDVRAAAAADPRGFLDQFQAPALLDEVQFAPGILPYIKERIDANRDNVGQYILTGSQNLLMLEQVTESLAGRAAMLRLLPLSYRELDDEPKRGFPWETKDAPQEPEARRHGLALWESFLRGLYPELARNPDRDAALWHASYIQTYLERDVRSIRNVGDLTLFQSFVRTLAARSGQLLNLTDIGRDLGIAGNTAKTWLSVLEATHQIIVLRPYHANIGKRLVKMPKVYFTDVGTLCQLTGLKDPDHARQGPLAGAIFETAVLSEIYKTFVHRGEAPHIYFWRTSSGSEVDIIVETGAQLIPVEVKLSETPHPNMAKGIKSFCEALGDQCGPGYVVHPGTVRLPLAPGVTALPFEQL